VKTPYAGSQTKPLGSFDYDLSSLRILAVQKIDKIVGRFGVQWSPMRCTLVKAGRTVVVYAANSTTLSSSRKAAAKTVFYLRRFKLLYYHWGNVSYMETVFAHRLHALLDLSLQSSDYHLHALQGCGLVGDGPSLGGPVCLLNEDEVSSFTRQSPCTSDSMHSTVRGSSSVRGPPSAFSPPLAPSPLAPPLLLPPPLGLSSLLPSLPLLAPAKPAPPKPDVTEGAIRGKTAGGRRRGRRVRARARCRSCPRR
jgi:hypothetical protein